MALEPITRKEKIIAGENLEPITRLEKFLKEYGGSGGSGGGGATTLHINITALNVETMEATFTADKTPREMLQASVNGPTWCVVTFEAGTMDDHAISIGLPPAWKGFDLAFGLVINAGHQEDGNNEVFYAVSHESLVTWIVNLSAFQS